MSVGAITVACALRHLTLVLRIEDVVDAGELLARLLGVVADRRHPRQPRHAVLPAGVEAHVLHVVDQVLLVGELGVVQRCHVAKVDQAAGHPVGEDDDVAVDALIPLERLVDLGEELAVVVDVLGVLRLDARGLLEVGHRLLVDVERPVRDPERLAAARGSGRRVAAGRGGALFGAATGGEQTVAQHQAAGTQCAAAQESAAGDRLAEEGVQLGVAEVGLSSAHSRTPARIMVGSGGLRYGRGRAARSTVYFRSGASSSGSAPT